MDDILSPHAHLLTTLLDWTPNSKLHLSDEVPAIAFSRKARKNSRLPAEREGMVPYAGNLTIIERAQIINRFSIHIPGAKTRTQAWITGVPIAHAYTLVLASRLRDADQEASSLDEEATDNQTFVLTSDLLHRAWQIQVSETDAASRALADVDCECISAFEERLFECSAHAGLAGFYQWGLDAGDHQARWNPYNEVPSGWDLHNYDWDYDEECKVNHFFRV